VVFIPAFYVSQKRLAKHHLMADNKCTFKHNGVRKMDRFQVIQMWNYHTSQYQDALIERTFNRGCAHITIHRWL
jgi:hypothetical protein